MADEKVTKEESNKDEVKKKNVEVPKEFKDLVTSIEKMTVLELSELVKVLEDKFGVSSAAPVMMASGGGGAGDGDSADEESSIVNIELTEGGGNMIAVIKVLRVVTELGLKDAKDLVDGAPAMVREGVPKEEAEEIKKKLEEAGAKVTFK